MFLFVATPWSKRLRIVPQSVEKVERGRSPPAVVNKMQNCMHVSLLKLDLLSLQLLVGGAAPVKGEPEAGADVGRRRRREAVGHEVDAKLIRRALQAGQLPRGARADDAGAEHAHPHSSLCVVLTFVPLCQNISYHRRSDEANIRCKLIELCTEFISSALLSEASLSLTFVAL